MIVTTNVFSLQRTYELEALMYRLRGLSATSSSKENSGAENNAESISVIDHSTESINNTPVISSDKKTAVQQELKLVLHQRQELMIHRQDNREASSSSSSSPISSSYRQAIKTSMTVVPPTTTSDRSEEDDEEEDEDEDVTEGVTYDPSLIKSEEMMTQLPSPVNQDQEDMKENVFPDLTTHQQLEKRTSGNGSAPSETTTSKNPSYSSIKCDIVEYL